MLHTRTVAFHADEPPAASMSPAACGSPMPSMVAPREYASRTERMPWNSAVLFLISDARETRIAGAALFPEILRVP